MTMPARLVEPKPLDIVLPGDPLIVEAPGRPIPGAAIAFAAIFIVTFGAVLLGAGLSELIHLVGGQP